MAEDRTFTCAECRRTWPYDGVDKVPSLQHRACICGECANPVPVYDHFGGSTYDPGRDKQRLSNQQAAVIEAMRSGEWMTIPQVADAIGAPPESLNAVGARIRDIRKIYKREDAVERKHLGGGLWTYRMTVGVAA